jgi:hypothetical protein
MMASRNLLPYESRRRSRGPTFRSLHPEAAHIRGHFGRSHLLA